MGLGNLKKSVIFVVMCIVASVLLSGIYCTDVWAAPRPTTNLDQVKGIVFLVPGIWNSVIPGNIHLNGVTNILESNPYFSEDVVSTFEQNNYGVYVIKGLNPLGDVKINGQITFNQIHDWYEANVPNHDIPITIVGHSMGGIYTLSALQKTLGFPIQKIVFVSTPLDGSPLADAVMSSHFSQALVNLISKEAINFFDLRVLPECTTIGIRNFFKQNLIPNDIKYFTVASYQDMPPTIFQMYDSRYLDPMLALAALLRNDYTDGIVPLTSALGPKELNFTRMPFYGRLDHVEQVLDYRILAALGFHSTGDVKRGQIQFYQNIIDTIEK